MTAQAKFQGAPPKRCRAGGSRPCRSASPIQSQLLVSCCILSMAGMPLHVWDYSVAVGHHRACMPAGAPDILPPAPCYNRCKARMLLAHNLPLIRA